MLLPLALALTLVPAHSRSEGRSSFLLDEEGRISIEITLSELDLPELCDADFSLRDRASQEQKLGQCLARDLPLLLRIKGDGAPCRVAYDRFTASNNVVVIEGSAACAALPHELTVDWGLFSGGALDHVSVCKIEQPFAAPRLMMLSRRNSHVVIDVKRPLWPWLAGASAGVVGVVAVAVVVLRRRRRATAATSAAQRPG